LGHPRWRITAASEIEILITVVGFEGEAALLEGPAHDPNVAGCSDDAPRGERRTGGEQRIGANTDDG